MGGLFILCLNLGVSWKILVQLTSANAERVPAEVASRSVRGEERRGEGEEEEWEEGTDGGQVRLQSSLV